MVSWINHVAIGAPRNGATTHSVTPSSANVGTTAIGTGVVAGTVLSGTLFTPTSGRLLVCIIEAAVTSTTPAGWTLPTGGSAINNSGLYVWTRTASATSADNITTTHNASGYPAVFDFYEFPAGTTFSGSAAATGVVSNTGASGPTLSGLTGVNWVAGAVGTPQGSSGTARTVTWATGVEAVDVSLPWVSPTDGYVYSLSYVEDSAATSLSMAATVSGAAVVGGVERLVFAVKIPANTVTGTLSASLPAVTAAVSGAVVSAVTGSVNAAVPLVAASISGSGVVTGSVAAAVPKPTANISGTVAVTGSVAATVPKVTSSVANVARLTVAEENALTSGVAARATWFDGVGSEEIPGFGRSTYYLPGDTAQFSINYNAAYTVTVWRLGHYQGNGARQVASFAGTPTSQPAATTIANSNGATTCAGWSNNVTWAVPADATPGWYQLLLSGNGGADLGHILFCVSDKLAKRDVVIVASDATWHCAYNWQGGKNLYGTTSSMWDPDNRALCVTYDKPVVTRDHFPQTHFFNANYPYLKWSERMGINAGYTTIEQINNDPSILDGRDVVVYTGHNEYVTQNVIDKTKELLNSGTTNIVNVAGNDMFWRVTMAGSTFPTGNTSTSTGRVMWCKKDSLAGPTGIRTGNAGVPFTNAADWTGTWQDTRWSGQDGSDKLFGDRFVANGIRADSVTVPFAMKGSPAWRNCAGVQALTSGQTYSFTAGSLGMEWDKPVTVTGGPLQTAFSSTTITLSGVAADINGAIYTDTETATHSFTMGRKGGGSYIANFNSDQWPWALEQIHLRGTTAADSNAMQMMLNVLVDLGAQADSTMVSAASLTMPTPVSNVSVSYSLPAIITGSMSATVPKVTTTITGASKTTGTLTAATPLLTTSVTGASLTTATLTATVPKVIASVTGVLIPPTTGTMTATVPKVTASFPGVIVGITGGTLDATIPLLTTTATGASLTTAALDTVLPRVTVDLSGILVQPVTGTLTATLPRITTTSAGAGLTIADLAATLPTLRANITDPSALRDVTFTGHVTQRVVIGRVEV